MKIITLPKDLNTDISDKLQLFNYKNFEDIQKTKISLSKHVISFLRIGQKEVLGLNKAVKINNQHFLIIKSGNCLMTERTSNIDRVYHSILLFFNDSMVVDFLEKYHNFIPSKISQKSFYVFEYDDFINQFVKSLEDVLKLPSILQKQLLKTKFEEIMLYLTFKHGFAFLNTIVQKIDDKVIRLNYIVESNKFNRLTLEELAFLCNMSVSTFKREFSNQYQKSPMKWFSEQRLNHTATLLRTKQKRPIDVYEEAGYENFSNFVQAFKRKFNITPKQYQSQF